jgi:hypothetical protein
VWRFHQLLSRFLANGHLPQVSHQSANDKFDNEIIPGAVHKSFGLTAEEIPGKTSSRKASMKAVPCLQMRSVGSHSMSGREKEGKKKRTG